MKIAHTLFFGLIILLNSCGDHIHGGKADGLSSDSSVGTVASTAVSVQHSSITPVTANPVADGSTLTQMRIVLRTKDDAPVANLRFKVKVSGNGNVVNSCSRTDSQGVAYCWFSSYFAEYKVFQVYDPVEIGYPIQFFESDSSLVNIGDIVVATSVGDNDPELFSTAGAFVDNTFMQDSSNSWVSNNMHGILHSRGY